MSRRIGLVAMAVGMTLGGVAWAQQNAPTRNVTITGQDAEGRPISATVVVRTDSDVAGQVAQAALQQGISQVFGWNFAAGRGFGTGAAAASGGNRWHLWASASYNRFGFSFQPAQTSGNISVLTAGLDYRFGNNLVVGAALAGDRSRTNLEYVAGGGNLSGDGYTIAPYLGYMINRSWMLDATIGYGRSDYDITGGGATGRFRGTRTFGGVGINYRYEGLGSRWQLTGRGALMSVNSRSGGYTVTSAIPALNNVSVNGTSSDVTQLRLGGQVAYAAGQVRPYIGLTYVYDIQRPGAISIGGQTSANDRDSWVPAIGLRFSTGGSVYGGLQISSERGRSEVRNDQLLFNLGVRF